jgi:enoyl-CoA hydratase
MLDWSDSNGIATLALDHGPVNALDGDFLREMTATLRAIEASDVDALILTGKDGVFSAGADLVRVLDGGREYVDASVDALSGAFEAAFTFNRPMVAAVNGHSIAGGAVFTCAADYRIMGEGSGVIGLAELRVGVPFPVWAHEIVRFAVAPQHLQEIILLAKNYPPPAALEKGLIDEIVDPSALLDRAAEVARALADVPRPTFEVMKRLLRRPAMDRVAAYSQDHDPTVQELWSSDEVRASIQRFLERLSAR